MNWEEELVHVAKLARIKLTDEQTKKFASQLGRVFEYMDVLKEVDVEGVAETSQVTGLQNVMEKDEVVKSQANREELLDCSQLPVDSKQIRVDKAIK